MPNGVKEVVEERVVKEVVRGMIPPGESDMWEAVALTVPPLVPANVHLTCRLLDVQYRIDMILEPPLPSADLKVSMPLTIGSVPLRNRFTTFLPPGETRRASGLPGINYSNFREYQTTTPPVLSTSLFLTFCLHFGLFNSTWCL
ncbi:hypothetical protein E2C01_092500 [Portunus trituberculatus]|uniref:Arrestin C-terminal-like domain-containing protein n=1 Tax=Portunus trituberculatus TaxID=210409 RepID=A0A5B7JQQ5_PORTR|nr:hypothetical protein [Portunus trituberculatus]